MRQYVLLREVSDESVKNQIRQEMIQKLAREWNALNDHIERLSWRDADDDKVSSAILKKEVVEELLSELGARMARPYEHWNEDERYMEYMESRYDNRD